MERNRSDESRKTVRVPSGAAIMRGDVTEALTRVFFDEWARTGYAGLSLERVARTAGVGKAALYRRWPDKASMASDLLSRVGLTITDVEERGSLEADLEAALFALRRVLRHPTVRRILTDLHGEIERTPALGAAIRPFQRARRERVDGLIDRAIERREVSPLVDRQMAADLIAAPLYWRLAVVGGRSDRAYIERLARVTGAAIRASEVRQAS
ncbi:TetR/AcrR family transcriptional regulator [Sphingomonas sp. PP-CE-1G-424]|uniref:TetR/AcrR family transcriptional regulator n=1 Tax=Sphingomonas sp. PP-CE-1G-424 TaxID=2135658 RepID=UPI0010564B04|nr:TetR/AcrR family transcriptional regulator [Sphingomonas sp. PP-CE-1G-424]TCP67512.1 TetR family transcriptional regulator [Sphingomonas sp. PP-CE-1G-424]